MMLPILENQGLASSLQLSQGTSFTAHARNMRLRPLFEMLQVPPTTIDCLCLSGFRLRGTLGANSCNSANARLRTKFQEIARSVPMRFWGVLQKWGLGA